MDWPTAFEHVGIALAIALGFVGFFVAAAIATMGQRR